MRVRLKLEYDESGWLLSGVTYPVLGVFGDLDGIKYRLLGNFHDTPALHEAEKFDVISAMVPNDWVFVILGAGEWELTPIIWSGSFWDNFFNGERPDAEEFAQAIEALDI